MHPRTCCNSDGTMKRAYSDKKQAKARKLKSQVIYHCVNCEWWHLASKHHS